MSLLIPGIFSYPGTSTVATGSALLLSDVISRLAASSTSNMILLSRFFPHAGGSFGHFSSPVVLVLCSINYSYSVATDKYGS